MLQRLVTRQLSCSAHLRRKLNLAKEAQALCLDQVADLPHADHVELASQLFHQKAAVDETKTPLVMLHGLFGAKQNYASVGRAIAAQTHRPVVGLDLRNHGSSAHAFPHTYTQMATDTIRHIEATGRSAVLAGHLMGAKVAMLVALRRPELVEKLIVIDNAPVNHVLDEQFTRDLVGMCHVERDLSLAGMSQLALLHSVDKILYKYEKSSLVRLFLASNLKRRLSRDDKRAVRFRVPVLNFLKHGVLGEMGAWPDVDLRYDGPVMVMRGTRSQFVSDENLAVDFPRYFSNVQSVDFDAGHWLVSEQPERFVEATVQFLGK